ncbi:hypothetical protein B9Z55_010284 [Caenorhabditis nigoni]|nr:hypothetical protein B9Z55_010284 [Caenorhabditis nigoni]
MTMDKKVEKEKKKEKKNGKTEKKEPEPEKEEDSDSDLNSSSNDESRDYESSEIDKSGSESSEEEEPRKRVKETKMVTEKKDKKENKRRFLKMKPQELKKFDGSDNAKYQDWKTTFMEGYGKNPRMTKLNKLIQLKGSVTGLAEELLDGVQLEARNYKVAWMILDENFEKPARPLLALERKFRKSCTESHNQDCFEMAIKFIFEQVKDYTAPESLSTWCEVARNEVGYPSKANALSSLIRRKLEEDIETLPGFSLSQKVQLLFLFSVRVNKDFQKRLQEAKLDVNVSNSKVTYFLSPEGIAYRSNHSKNLQNFKEILVDKKPTEHKEVTVEKLPIEKARCHVNMDLDEMEKVIVEEEILEEGKKPVDEQAGFSSGVSLWKLSQKIELFAYNYKLDARFHEKCWRAVCHFEKGEEMIPTDEFLQIFDVIVMSSRRKSSEKPIKESMKLKTFFTLMQTSLVDLLGKDSIQAEKILEKVTGQVGSHHEISLQTIQIILDCLMDLSTNAWSELDE